MVNKKKNILKTKLIVLMASVVCVLSQSAAPANNRPNFGSQDPSRLNFYYHDAEQTHGMRVQPKETHSRNLQSIYSRNEKVNFAYMSKSEFGQVFQDVADENAILQNYELYAFEGFKDYARGLKGYKKFILSLQDKIQNDKKFRQQTANIPGFEYSFFLWREKSGFHEFINEEARAISDEEAYRIISQKNFSRGADVQELLKELRSDSSEYKAVPWAVGYEDRNNKRLHALDQINSGKGVWATKKYVVSDSFEVLQKDFEPKLSSLKEFYGNQFQHVLHDEFIDILKKSEPIYRSKSAHVFDKELTQAVVHFAGVGVEHNAHGHCQKAMGISDFCNSVIEYIDAFELKLFGDNNPVVTYIDAFESGLQDGVRKKISELSSPVEYVKNLAVGMLTMAGCLVKVLSDTQLQTFLVRFNPEAVQLKFLDDVQQAAQLIKIAQTYYKNNSGPTMVRQGAELLTDVALDVYFSGKILNAFVKLGKIGLAQRAETVSFVKEFRPRRMASFHPAQSDELVITAEKAAKILVDNKPYSPAAEVVELTSQALIENSCNAELVINPGKPTNSGVVPPAPKNPITPATKVSQIVSEVTENCGWSMPEKGRMINGRWYTQHALERMAPDTIQVRAILEKRAIEAGHLPGSKKFVSYVDPRGIPPSVVENAISHGTKSIGKKSGTLEISSDNIQVIISESTGAVITVIPK